MTYPRTSLLGLPIELQEIILEHLDPSESIPLKLTCHHFNNFIPPAEKHDKLLAAERSPFARRKNLYACRECLHLLPASKFADQMLRYRRAKNERDARKRFCLECGLSVVAKVGEDGRKRSGRLYTRGSRILIQGEWFIICVNCENFNKLARDLEGLQSPFCESCFPYCDEDYLQEQYFISQGYQSEKMRQWENSRTNSSLPTQWLTSIKSWIG